MKILHVCKKYPHALGGDAVVVANLQKQQQAIGHDVVVVTSNCDEIVDGKRVYKVGLKDTPAKLDEITPTRIASLVMLLFSMFPILRRERPDIIHTHSVDMAFIVSFAARFYRIPIIHTFHIVTFYDNSQPPIRRKTELLLAKAAGLRRVTAPNGYDVRRLQAAGLRQTVLLPNGVDLSLWHPDDRPKRHQKFIFLAVGRLERQKGYDYLIKAASLLEKLKPDGFRITIIGDGSQATELDKLRHALHVEDMVSLIGRRNPDEIRLMLPQADAAVLPSLYETTPITLLEAWSVAIPVIATSVGLLRDEPADFGGAYIVPPKDEQMLMQAMYRCMIDKALRVATAVRGHSEARKYAWPVIAKTAEEIYRGTQ